MESAALNGIKLITVMYEDHPKHMTQLQFA